MGPLSYETAKEYIESDSMYMHLTNEWFDNNKEYDSKYRGAGVILLTWDYNYIAFEEWMRTKLGVNDPNIISKGAEYVATNYPWEAAVFFWDDNNLNEKADVEDIDGITAVVNKKLGEEEYLKRKEEYNKWMSY